MSFPKIRDITLELLTQCGIEAPPVDLRPILELFHATVVNSSHIAESALLERKDGWTIKVNSSFREERREFRIAHEIAHIYWSAPEHHRGDPNLGGGLEKFCSKFASLLLCPHQWFVRDAPEAGYDLFELKKIYANVSHEVLAFRLSYLTAMVVSIFDNGKLYRRFTTPGMGIPPAGQKPEAEVLEEVDLYGKFREKRGTLKWNNEGRKVRVRGYPVFSGGFRRIILVTTPEIVTAAAAGELEEDMPYPFPEY